MGLLSDGGSSGGGSTDASAQYIDAYKSCPMSECSRAPPDFVDVEASDIRQ